MLSSIRTTKTGGKTTSIMQCNLIAEETMKNMGYLGKATVSTIPKSCRSKSRFCLLASITMFWPIPICIADISSEVGFCRVPSQRKTNETLAITKFANKNDYLKELTWERKWFQRCGSPHTEHLVLALVTAFLYCAVCQAGWWPSTLR